MIIWTQFIKNTKIPSKLDLKAVIWENFVHTAGFVTSKIDPIHLFQKEIPN